MRRCKKKKISTFFYEENRPKKATRKYILFIPQNYHPKYDMKNDSKKTICSFFYEEKKQKYAHKIRDFLRLKKSELLFIRYTFYENWVILTTFFRLFIINLLLKMTTPLILLIYFVKKWVVYYASGFFFCFG